MSLEEGRGSGAFSRLRSFPPPRHRNVRNHRHDRHAVRGQQHILHPHAPLRRDARAVARPREVHTVRSPARHHLVAGGDALEPERVHAIDDVPHQLAVGREDLPPRGAKDVSQESRRNGGEEPTYLDIPQTRVEQRPIEVGTPESIGYNEGNSGQAQ